MVWVKRLLSLVFLAVLVYFFWPLIGEIKKVGPLIQNASWIWLGGALLSQVVSYGFLTWLNALALQPFAGRIRFIPLAFLLTAMAFIEIALPSAGASGIALRVRLLRKFGYSPEASLFSLAVESLSELAALVSIALLGVAFLFSRGRFSLMDGLWLGAGGAAFLLMIWLSWQLILDKERSRRFALTLAGWWNRLLGRFRKVNLPKLEERLVVFRESLGQYRQVQMWKFVLAAYGKVLWDVTTLGTGFYLFNYAISPGRLFTGYGLILTFSGLANLPGGLGMADAYAPVLFSWLGVPGSVALAAGLAYRLIAFWLIRFTGYFSWLYLEAKYKQKLPQTTETHE